ncbi:hypothetical protein WJX77_002993 [Trebouxia sp. C0004]
MGRISDVCSWITQPGLDPAIEVAILLLVKGHLCPATARQAHSRASGTFEVCCVANLHRQSRQSRQS